MRGVSGVLARPGVYREYFSTHSSAGTSGSSRLRQGLSAAVGPVVGSLRSSVINSPLVPLSLRDIYTEPWSSRVEIGLSVSK